MNAMSKQLYDALAKVTPELEKLHKRAYPNSWSEYDPTGSMVYHAKCAMGEYDDVTRMDAIPKWHWLPTTYYLSDQTQQPAECEVLHCWLFVRIRGKIQ